MAPENEYLLSGLVIVAIGVFVFLPITLISGKKRRKREANIEKLKKRYPERLK